MNAVYVQTKSNLGRDIWVPVEVDIDAHVSESVEFNDKEKAAPHFIQSYVSHLQNSPPMDPSRPLWHCHILNGTSGIAASHMVIRVHHAFGDGTSLMSLLLACTRRLDSPDQLPSVPVASKKRKEKTYVARWFCEWFWYPILLFWNTILGVLQFLLTVLWFRDSDSIIKGNSGVENAKKKIVCSVIKINDMIAVKNAVEGVSSDNMIAFTSSVLHPRIYAKFVATEFFHPGKNSMTLEICLPHLGHLVKDFMTHELKRVIRLIWGCRTKSTQIKLSMYTILSTIMKVKYRTL